MALLDPAAQNASLDNDYGATKGPNAAANLEIALYTGDPLLDGEELTAAGGYARAAAANDGATWPDAAAGGQKTSAAISFGTSTAAWSDTATWFVVIDAADHTTRWDSGLLVDEIDVTGAGQDVETSITVYYDANQGA